jgi:catechol 2,3-dioxygenase-like lactoylglutathione lyase family enzyme
MVKATGLNHIHLNVSDVERSLRFYKGAFGFDEAFRTEEKMVFLQPSNGARHTITLREAMPTTPGR